MPTSNWRKDVTLYLAITFGITWGLALVAIGFPTWFREHFGVLSATSPWFYLAVWAPNIAAIVATVVRGGRVPLTDLFGAVARWRVAPRWWLAAILFYPALMFCAQLLARANGQALPDLSHWTVFAIGIFNVPALLLGALGEELGWRGYLLPRFIARYGPTGAALAVGTIWMIWHLPAFFVSGLPQSNLALPIFVVSGVALSLFMTWLYVNARGSVLIAGIIPHAIVNAFAAPMPSMAPIPCFVLVAAALVLIATVGSGLQSGANRQTPDSPRPPVRLT